MSERPWWWPERTDAEWCARVREDYPEDVRPEWTDEEVRDVYADGRKYQTLWDHTGDAYEQFEKLADAFLASPWRPWSELDPEEYEEVLGGWLDKGRMLCESLYREQLVADDEEPSWCWVTDEGRSVNNPTHWMPIPPHPEDDA